TFWKVRRLTNNSRCGSPKLADALLLSITRRRRNEPQVVWGRFRVAYKNGQHRLLTRAAQKSCVGIQAITEPRPSGSGMRAESCKHLFSLYLWLSRERLT